MVLIDTLVALLVVNSIKHLPNFFSFSPLRLRSTLGRLFFLPVPCPHGTSALLLTDKPLALLDTSTFSLQDSLGLSKSNALHWIFKRRASTNQAKTTPALSPRTPIPSASPKSVSRIPSSSTSPADRNFQHRSPKWSHLRSQSSSSRSPVFWAEPVCENPCLDCDHDPAMSR